jgi:hypothetical protein
MSNVVCSVNGQEIYEKKSAWDTAPLIDKVFGAILLGLAFGNLLVGDIAFATIIGCVPAYLWLINSERSRAEYYKQYRDASVGYKS